VAAFNSHALFQEVREIRGPVLTPYMAFQRALFRFTGDVGLYAGTDADDLPERFAVRASMKINTTQPETIRRAELATRQDADEGRAC